VQGPRVSNSIIAYTLFWRNGLDSDQSMLGLGNIFGQDPRFASGPLPGPDGAWGTVDDDFGGLVLGNSSPAIDRGTTQYAAPSGEEVPASPLTGFSGAAPDLGWREWGSALLPPGTPSPTRTTGPAVTATAFTPSVGNTPVTGPPPAAASATAANVTVTATQPGIPDTGDLTPTATEGTGTPAESGRTPSPAAPAAETATASPEPVLAITGISPQTATTGETLTLTVTGTGFAPDLVLSFEGATGTPPNVIAVQVLDPTTVIATIEALNSTAEQQVWDVRIDNPDGTSALLESGFTVVP
jgi:hypothetical protein